MVLQFLEFCGAGCDGDSCCVEVCADKYKFFCVFVQILGTYASKTAYSTSFPLQIGLTLEPERTQKDLSVLSEVRHLRLLVFMGQVRLTLTQFIELMGRAGPKIYYSYGFLDGVEPLDV